MDYLVLKGLVDHLIGGALRQRLDGAVQDRLCGDRPGRLPGLVGRGAARRAEDEGYQRGGLSLEPLDEIGPHDPIVQTAAVYASLLASSLTVSQAAQILGVTTGRVRQELYAGTIYGLKEVSAWRLPRWQFADDLTGLLPGIRRVLPHLDRGLHPVAILYLVNVRTPGPEHRRERRGHALAARLATQRAFSRGGSRAGRRVGDRAVAMPKLPQPPPAHLLAGIAPDPYLIPAGTELWRVYARGGAYPRSWNTFWPVSGGNDDTAFIIFDGEVQHAGSVVQVGIIGGDHIDL